MCRDVRVRLRRLRFLLRLARSRRSKNRTAIRSVNRETRRRRDAIENGRWSGFYLTFARDTGCIVGESRTDYRGNTVILVPRGTPRRKRFTSIRARSRFSRETRHLRKPFVKYE